MIIEIIKSKNRKQPYRLRLKFSNGLIFMHSERYANKTHAHSVAKKLTKATFRIKEIDE